MVRMARHPVKRPKPENLTPPKKGESVRHIARRTPLTITELASPYPFSTLPEKGTTFRDKDLAAIAFVVTPYVSQVIDSCRPAHETPGLCWSFCLISVKWPLILRPSPPEPAPANGADTPGPALVHSFEMPHHYGAIGEIMKIPQTCRLSRDSPTKQKFFSCRIVGNCRTRASPGNTYS